MPAYVLKNILIVDPASSFNGQKVNLLIDKGKILDISTSLSNDTKAESIDLEGAFVSPGWIDMYCALRDPGFEYKESFESTLNSAQAGGFTGICAVSETSPIVQNKSEIEYVKSTAKPHIVDVYPYGALTKNKQGKELTEMFDMHNAGAKGFTDGLKSLSSDVVLRSLQYVRQFGGLVLDFPDDKSISAHTSMHEGFVSVALGLKGSPDIAEVLGVYKAIALLGYTDSKLHLAHISSASSLELIRKAKSNGLKISASVSSLNLCFNHKALEGFDTNFKLRPVLRSENDRKALIAAVVDGTIDVICSNHFPEDQESKDVEFGFSAHGASNVDTSFSAICMGMGSDFDVNNLVSVMSINPRRILGIDVPTIEVGKQAELTVFDPTIEWVYDSKHRASGARNSPFIGKTLKGRALYTINKGQLKKI